jgi:hypothetical protein
MALNAAWPLLANAEPVDPSSEICSASGLKHAGGGPAAPEKDLHASHCTLCPFGAQLAAPIPQATQAPSPRAAAVAPIARADAPRLKFAFQTTAPPRAPPVLS